MSSGYNSETRPNPPNPGRGAVGFCRAAAGFDRVSKSIKLGKGAIGYCRASAGFDRALELYPEDNPEEAFS